MAGTAETGDAEGASTVLAELHRVLAQGGDGGMKFLNIDGASTIVGDSSTAATGTGRPTVFAGHGNDVPSGSQADGHSTLAGSGVVALGPGNTTVFAELGPDTISAITGASQAGADSVSFLGDGGQVVFVTGDGADLLEFSRNFDDSLAVAPPDPAAPSMLAAEFHDFTAGAGGAMVLLSDSTSVTFADLPAPSTDLFG